MAKTSGGFAADVLPRPSFAPHGLRRAVRVQVGSSLPKWVGLGVAVGVLGGLVALALIQAIEWSTQFLLGGIAGYHVAEDGTGFTLSRWWLLPLVPALGGLVSGVIIRLWAPSAAGIGTDAAIQAFHESRPISLRTTFLKLFASAVTIGTGGTSGQEGPVAQVGAGIGSWIGHRFGWTRHDCGIALAAGLGAGIAALFKAPLAGAIIAAEVFYREDFEVDAIVPALVASVVGYSVVGFAHGFEPVFQTDIDPFRFGHWATLGLYLLLGVLTALLARLAILALRIGQGRFPGLPMPWRPAVGGLLTGSLALVLIVTLGAPVILGTGHPWMQAVLDGDAPFRSGVALPLLLLAAALAEILGSTFTLASGASGGIFGPSIVVGGFAGAAFGSLAAGLFPAIVPDPAPFAIVGMIAYFAGAAKAPLATIVMVVEMTGGYAMLAPAMLAVTFSYLLSGPGSVFRHQLGTRLDSPFHAEEFEPLVLRRTRVQTVMDPESPTLTPAAKISEALTYMEKTGVRFLPVVEPPRLVGVLARRDLLRMPEWDRGARPVSDVMMTDAVCVRPDQDLYLALARMLEREYRALPVVDRDGRYQGVLRRQDIAAVVKRARPDADRSL